MPGNAGLLLAGKIPSRRMMRRLLMLQIVAYMAEGWDGSKGSTPGFPKNDGWTVNHEGLRKAL